MGGYVIGICNGFQILCESGLLPGVLLANSNQKFICKNLHIKVENNDTPYTSNTKAAEVLKIPIAHADGRYFASEKVLKELKQNKQILYKYCAAQGSVSAARNANGSIEYIAGLCSAE